MGLFSKSADQVGRALGQSGDQRYGASDSIKEQAKREAERLASEPPAPFSRTMTWEVFKARQSLSGVEGMRPDLMVGAVNGGWLIHWGAVMHYIADPSHENPPYPVEIERAAWLPGNIQQQIQTVADEMRAKVIEERAAAQVVARARLAELDAERAAVNATGLVR